MKKHNIFKVVLITFLVVALFTWILPVAYFSSGYGYVEQGRMQVGLFDLISYPLMTFQYFGLVFLFVIAIGGLYGVLNKISAYRVFLDKLANSFKNKSKLVISIMIAVLAILTSIGGLQLGLLLFVPMLISLILLMGYDKITAALAIVGSLVVGVAGTTFGYNNINFIMSTLNVKITSGIISKIVILLAGIALVTMNTLLYMSKCDKKATKKVAKKTTKKATKTKEVLVKENDAFVPEKVSARKKTTIAPLVVILSIVLVVVVLSFIPWSGAFKIKAFETATKAVTKFKLFGFPIFGKLLGTVNAFGVWTVSELTIITILATLLLSFIYKVKFDDMVDGIVAGVKRALPTAIIVVLIYACLVVAAERPYQMVIYKVLLDLSKGFNVVTGGLVAILASFFNVDPSYTFQSVLPYVASVSNKGDFSLIGLVFQSMYGLTMLFAPTSVVLMAVLSYLDIPYTKWLKTIWKLILELLLLLFVIFIIILLV